MKHISICNHQKRKSKSAAAKKIVKSLSELISGGFQPFGTILQQEEGCARCQITIRVLLPWPPQLRPLRPLRSLCQLQLGDRRVFFGFSDPRFVNIYFLRSILSIQKKIQMQEKYHKIETLQFSIKKTHIKQVVGMVDQMTHSA